MRNKGCLRTSQEAVGGLTNGRREEDLVKRLRDAEVGAGLLEERVTDEVKRGDQVLTCIDRRKPFRKIGLKVSVAWQARRVEPTQSTRECR